MMLEEAQWLNVAIALIPNKRNGKLINIGSQTEVFRKRYQSLNVQYVIDPLEEKGYKPIHIDIQKGQGIDYSGDICDASFRTEIRELKPDVVLCSNLLEHVPSPKKMATAIVDLVESGGFIITSCPKEYPYHPDPIDNKLRPASAELTALFSGTTELRSSTVDCGTMRDLLRKRRFGFARSILRTVFPVWKPNYWLRDAAAIKWAFLNKRLSATCVILTKN